ncbi:MAG: lipopolysaccharide assembly LapA domain-containing protein [Microthrixaceae bacterium]
MLTDDSSNQRAAAEREPGDLTPPSADAGTAEPDGPEMRVTRTRTGSALVATVLGLVLALLMLIFVLQNGERQQYEFLWTDFSLPAGVAMLFAAIVGGLVVALIGLGRIVQIRLAARRHRKADRQAHA